MSISAERRVYFCQLLEALIEHDTDRDERASHTHAITWCYYYWLCVDDWMTRITLSDL